MQVLSCFFGKILCYRFPDSVITVHAIIPSNSSDTKYTDGKKSGASAPYTKTKGKIRTPGVIQLQPGIIGRNALFPAMF